MKTLKTDCVLFLFNSSTYAPQPWLDAGIHCVSVDYDDTDHSAHRSAHKGEGLHTRISMDLSEPMALWGLGEALEAKGLSPKLVISFAPCTDMAVSGAAHFKAKLAKDPKCQEKAVSMAQLAPRFGVPYAVENPVSILASKWRKPDYYCHPYEFASRCPEGPHPEAPDLFPAQDLYPKKTCLWTGNGFTHPLKDEVTGEKGAQFPGFLALGGKSARTKHLRSLTPRGLSQAIFDANKGLFKVILPQKEALGLDKVVTAAFLCETIALHRAHSTGV